MPEKELADLAREGALDALVSAARARATSGPNADRDEYRWLCAAVDFGHEEADDRISDLLEHSSLRYDDSGFEHAAAHWELGVAYLRGLDGLPKDLALAEAHLDHAFRHRPGRDVLAEINTRANESFSADAALEGLPSDARLVLEGALEGDSHRRVRHLLERVERLYEVGAPDVIVENEESLLRAALAQLGARRLDDDVRERVERVLRR